MVTYFRLVFIVLLMSIYGNGIAQESIEKHEILMQKGDSTIYIDYNVAWEFYEEAFSIAKNNNLKKEMASAIARKAIVERMRTHYDKAVSYNLEALKLYEEIKDTLLQSMIYHNLGFLFKVNSDFDRASENYLKAIEIRKQFNDSTELATSYSELGVVRRNQKRYDDAMQLYETALRFYDKEKNASNIRTVKGSIASLYLVTKQYDKSIAINKDALADLKISGKKEGLISRYSNIGYAYEKKKDYENALTYVDSAIMIANQGGLLEQAKRKSYSKARVYYKMKEYKKAYKQHRKYKKLSDSLYNKSKIQEVTKQIVSFEYEKKILKDSIETAANEAMLVAKLEKETTQKKYLFWISILLIMSLISSFLWIRNRRRLLLEKTKTKSLEKEMLEKEMAMKEQETRRLIEDSYLQNQFKISISDKIEKLIKENSNPENEKKLLDLKRELADQLRIESQSQILNENIEKKSENFEKFLRMSYPVLTKSERKVCSFIRAGLSIKDIANLRESSTASVQSLRYRIRKKLNVEKGTELMQFLEDLYD